MKKRWRPYEVLLALGVASLLLAVAVLRGGLPCPIKSLVGLPCPTCGISRALWSALHGHLGEAFFWHPLWILLPGLLLLYILQHNERFSMPQRLWRSKWLWAALVTVLLFIYLARMFLFYPHMPPMDPQAGALLFPLFARLGF